MSCTIREERRSCNGRACNVYGFNSEVAEQRTALYQENGLTINRKGLMYLSIPRSDDDESTGFEDDDC